MSYETYRWGPNGITVDEALDVLRAAGYQTDTEYDNVMWRAIGKPWNMPEGTKQRTVVRSPWQEVKDRG